jgi:hypothetical protein
VAAACRLVSPGDFCSDLYTCWQLLVGEYSQRCLTLGSDKFKAVQRIANDMSAATGWDYLDFEGMWRHNLERELLWFAPSADDVRMPDKPRVPTWSWASLGGPLHYRSRILSNTQRSISTSLDSTFEEYPFEVQRFGNTLSEHFLGRESHGYVQFRALTRRISGRTRLEEPERGRVFFPYDLLLIDGNSPDENSDHTAVERIFCSWKVRSRLLGIAPL